MLRNLGHFYAKKWAGTQHWPNFPRISNHDLASTTHGGPLYQPMVWCACTTYWTRCMALALGPYVMEEQVDHFTDVNNFWSESSKSGSPQLRVRSRHDSLTDYQLDWLWLISHPIRAIKRCCSRCHCMSDLNSLRWPDLAHLPTQARGYARAKDMLGIFLSPAAGACLWDDVSQVILFAMRNMYLWRQYDYNLIQLNLKLTSKGW